ncbi:MAG: baseplate assembly protein, partial [Caulobacteraceae bacterium]
MSTFASQASGSTAVDLSKLPFPAVIEVLSYDQLVQERKDALIASVAAEDIHAAAALAIALQLPSDPLVKLIEIEATREMNLRQRVNDAAKARMLAYAVGSDLDHTVAPFGIERLVIQEETETADAIDEGDDALRRRALLAPEGYSVAGPEGAYIFHALSASGTVLDASATSPEPGQVVVTVLSRLNNGVPDAPLLALVAAAVSAEGTRPLTDHVLVSAADILEFLIEARIHTFAGPDAAVVLAEANARLQRYLEDSYRLGRDVTRSGIITALSADGVQDVELIHPAANVVVSRTQAARCTAVSVTHVGLG